MPKSISRAGWQNGFFRRALWLSVFFASIAGSSLVIAQSRQQNNLKKQETQESKSDEGKESAEAKDKKAEDTPKKVMIGGVEWYVDYDAALKIAREKDKPMWLHFGENPG